MSFFTHPKRYLISYYLILVVVGIVVVVVVVVVVVKVVVVIGRNVVVGIELNVVEDTGRFLLDSINGCLCDESCKLLFLTSTIFGAENISEKERGEGVTL